MSATNQFDAALSKGHVTSERGSVYGHPLDDFEAAVKIKDVLADCPDLEVRHALEMIGVKLVRLAQTPDHLDSIIDIAGYARTICMVLDERARRAGWGSEGAPL